MKSKMSTNFKTVQRTSELLIRVQVGVNGPGQELPQLIRMVGPLADSLPQVSNVDWGDETMRWEWAQQKP